MFVVLDVGDEPTKSVVVDAANSQIWRNFLWREHSNSCVLIQVCKLGDFFVYLKLGGFFVGRISGNSRRKRRAACVYSFLSADLAFCYNRQCLRSLRCDPKAGAQRGELNGGIAQIAILGHTFLCALSFHLESRDQRRRPFDNIVADYGR